MTQPKLSTVSSGLGGRGYRDIFGSGDILPSITTALGALSKGEGLVHWHAEQTAMYCVTHVDDLLNRTEEAGVRYAQYYSRRKPDDLDDPELNPYNAARYVLDDYSNTGTWIHRFIEMDLNDEFTDEPQREDHWEMSEAWLEWKAQHDIEVLATEATVYGDGYAGTGDIWAKIDGVPYVIDTKSSRKLHSVHVGQIAAIGAAHTMAQEVSSDTEGAVYHKLQPKVAAEHGGQVDSWWVPRAPPEFSSYAVLQVRPHDWDTDGTPIKPFVKLHTIPQHQIDPAYKLFRAGLSARLAERGMKLNEKENK